MRCLGEDYTIVIVTHNKQRARRATGEDKAGILEEHSPFSQSFASPKDKRSGDYIAGRFG